MFHLLFSRPCILIFDSLQTGLRSRVVATLREYLQCEYKAKMNKDREFTKDTMKGASPKVPQQPNFSDCGLFALQYVESFFKTPVKSYQLPLVGLKKWFPSDVMRNKRAEIAKIIRNLAGEQNKDKNLEFPELSFTPVSGSGYSDDENEDSDKMTKPQNPKFFVKSGGANTLATAGTRVICLTSSKSLSLTSGSPSKVVHPNPGGPLMIQKKKGKIEYFTLQGGKQQKSLTPVKKPPSSVIAAAQNAAKQAAAAAASGQKQPATGPTKPISGPSRTVLIPKLISGPGEKLVKKEIKETATNGPSKTNSDSEDGKNLVNYSDSSSEEGQQQQNNQQEQNNEDTSSPHLDMEVDEDGAPFPFLPQPVASLPKPVNSVAKPVNSVANSAATLPGLPKPVGASLLKPVATSSSLKRTLNEVVAEPDETGENNSEAENSEAKKVKISETPVSHEEVVSTTTSNSDDVSSSNDA